MSCERKVGAGGELPGPGVSRAVHHVALDVHEALHHFRCDSLVELWNDFVAEVNACWECVMGCHHPQELTEALVLHERVRQQIHADHFTHAVGDRLGRRTARSIVGF
ncbi:hypothetical protein EYF80_029488 [Liparis tanakae]|uniref:Uncharacterized protein n=1 Tax=Liparis tanakae TaxID=230148 RepID=A0A4Z2H5H1_9TELE|nr:hypothetical protein EYF80_029488 [Liparis tanakae]